MSGWGDEGIRAFIKRVDWLDAVDVYVFARGSENYALVIEDGMETWKTFPEGTEPPRLMRLKPHVWDAIQREAGRHTQASDATVEALRDTREVRDRLLTLVEKDFA